MGTRGRPKGSVHGTLKQNAWVPKKWRPEYDRVVAYSVVGKANTWIAEQLGFTPEHVSSILNTPQGLELASKLQAKLRENIELNIPETLGELAVLATKRLKSLLENDAIFEKSPFAVVDRGLDVLKGLKHLQGGGNGAPGQTTNIGTAVIVTPGQRSDILDGLQRIADIKKLHAGTGNGDS